MPKLYENVQTQLGQINSDIENILSSINNFSEIFNKKYVLSEIKDVEILKDLMRDKIEMGLRNYDL